MRALIAAATGLALAFALVLAISALGSPSWSRVRGHRRQQRLGGRPATPSGREAGMRRKASLVLPACAVFCAALAPLSRWYAFPRLARIPANQYQAMVLEARNATLLDYGTMRAKKVSDVTVVQTRASSRPRRTR